MPTLKSSNSPHLAMYLEQLAKSGELDEGAARKILVSFETAFSKHGAQEIGFQREAGQSFNPRAARILLILLKDGKVFNLDKLCMAAERAGEGVSYQGYVELEAPVEVSGAFLLDRLRHLHLETGAAPDQIYFACLRAKELLSSDFSHLALMLEKGVERMKRNLK